MIGQSASGGANQNEELLKYEPIGKRYLFVAQSYPSTTCVKLV